LRPNKKNKKMKKTLILLFVTALGAGTMSSCSKSNKGKLSGEWTINSYSTTYAQTSGNPSVTNTEVMTLNGSTITSVSSSSSAGAVTSTENGTVAAATWNIEKDGTWTRIIDMTFTVTEPTYSFSNQNVTTESGTWSFVGKNKTADLKKNERVVMSTLSSSSTVNSTYTVGGVSSTDTSTDTQTYSEGEYAETFLIVESKSKELSLSQVGASTSTSTDSNGTTTSSSTADAAIVLTQE